MKSPFLTLQYPFVLNYKLCSTGKVCVWHFADMHGSPVLLYKQLY